MITISALDRGYALLFRNSRYGWCLPIPLDHKMESRFGATVKAPTGGLYYRLMYQTYKRSK